MNDYNNTMKEIARRLSDNQFNGFVDMHEHNDIKYIMSICMDLYALGSEQKGSLRIEWNNIDGTIEEKEDMDITIVIHVEEKERCLYSYIHIEDLKDMKHDIENIKDQIRSINAMYIYDLFGDMIWNCFE